MDLNDDFGFQLPLLKLFGRTNWGYSHLHVAVEIYVVFCCPLLNQGLWGSDDS